MRIGKEFLCGSCAVEDLRTEVEAPLVLCDLCLGESTLRLDERFLCGRCALSMLCEADAEPDLVEATRSALAAAVEGEPERAIARAWEMAKLVREGELMVADVSRVHHRVLAEAVEAEVDRGRAARWVEAASRLFGAFAASLDGHVEGLAERVRALRAEVEGLGSYSDQLRAERDEANLRVRRAARQRASLVRHLTNAKEEERNRIAEEIHDDTVQTLVAVQMRLQTLGSSRTAGEAREPLAELARVTGGAIGRLRRLMFELRSDLLERYGLGGTLRELLGRTEEHAGIRFRLEDRLGYEPSADVRANVYRIAQEAVSNVRKHSGATGVDVQLADRDGGVLLTVRDDGRGFDEGSVPALDHAGLRFMRDRAERAGGWLSISSEEGSGTDLTCWVPNRAEEVGLGAA